MKQITDIIELFRTSKCVLVTTHIRPDADAIGSGLALYHFFKAKNIEVNFIVPNEPAEYYNWFPCFENILIFEKEKENGFAILEQSDLVIVVDFSQLSRNGEFGKAIAQSKVTKIVIDHHPEPEMIFDAYYWDTAFCAAAEAVFEVLKTVDEFSVKDLNISICLYAALIADSGSFSFPSVSTKTHLIAAELIKSGIDHSWIDKQIFKKFSERRLHFWGFCLKDKLKIFLDGKLAIISINKSDFKDWRVKYPDTENLVNMPMMIENVMVSVLLIEKEDKVKISLRSKEEIAVNSIARDYFSGGGHKNAAGGDSEKSLEETEQIIIEKIGKLL